MRKAKPSIIKIPPTQPDDRAEKTPQFEMGMKIQIAHGTAEMVPTMFAREQNGAQIRMKISPTLARNSSKPVSRYFPRNFSTRCDAASELCEFQLAKAKISTQLESVRCSNREVLDSDGKAKR